MLGLLLQDSNFRLRKGPGQLDQCPVWPGTGQGATGLHWVSHGTEQGLDVLFHTQGCSVQGQSLKQQTCRGTRWGWPQAELGTK